MPRSTGQSDFVFTTPPAEVVEEEHVKSEATQGSAFATKVMLTITCLVLLAIALLCTVAAHMPSGG